MDFILNWLREERDVIRRAKVTAALILALGLIVGFSASSFLYDRRVDDAQQAAATAQQNRDLWKDKYDDLTASLALTKAPEKIVAPKPRPPSARHHFDPVRTGLLVAAIFTGLLALLFVAPLPGRKSVSIADLSKQAVPADPKSASEAALRSEARRIATPNVAATLKAEQLQNAQWQAAGETPLHHLQPGPGEKPARAHIRVADAVPDRHSPPGKPKQIRGLLTLENVTASPLSTCTVVVDSFHCEGVKRPVLMPVLVGGATAFTLAAHSRRGMILVYRDYEVAPEQLMKLNARDSTNALRRASDVFLDDNKTYLINLSIDAGAGVVTRAIIRAIVGEYEDLNFSLVDQSSWRLSPTGTGAANL